MHESAVERFHTRDPRSREIIADHALMAASASMRAARQVGEPIAAMVDALHRDPTHTGPAVAMELRRVVPVETAGRSTLGFVQTAISTPGAEAFVAAAGAPSAALRAAEVGH